MLIYDRANLNAQITKYTDALWNKLFVLTESQTDTAYELIQGLEATFVDPNELSLSFGIKNIKKPDRPPTYVRLPVSVAHPEENLDLLFSSVYENDFDAMRRSFNAMRMYEESTAEGKFWMENDRYKKDRFDHSEYDAYAKLNPAGALFVQIATLRSDDKQLRTIIDRAIEQDKENVTKDRN